MNTGKHDLYIENTLERRREIETRAKKNAWDHFVISDFHPRGYEIPGYGAEALRKACGTCGDVQGRK